MMNDYWLTLNGKWWHRLSMTLLLVCAFLTSTAQNTTVKGTVTDEEGAPMPGVLITSNDAMNGTATDLEGKYTIEVASDGTLTFSFLGFEEQVVVVGARAVIDVTLVQSADVLEEVMVTGVMNPQSKLESSVSVTTLSAADIQKTAPRSTAEVFRNIPGIKVEASAGDGNTNMTVRGVPISAGGSRYLQIQEDGLPVMLYGDIAFATQDQFLRIDNNVERVEAIRGGSAAILTSNGPAGIINMISKTGQREGGAIATSFGLDYNSTRVDFDYGSPIGNGVSFHAGGFFRVGEGPRRANHVVNNGGQIKMNLTKAFKNGIARVYYKMIDDRTAAYMPMPIQVEGTNSNPTWSSVQGLSAVNNGLHSPYLRNSYGYGPDGSLRSNDIANGIHSKVHSIGTSFDFDLGEGWTVTSNHRMSFINGGFNAPFTAQVGPTRDVLDQLLIDNGDTTASGAAGSYTINRVASGETITDTENGLAQRIHIFDVALENMNNFFSDTRVTKSLIGEKLNITAGTFMATQKIKKSWLWNTYMMEVKEDAEPLNVTNARGQSLTHSGQSNYGVPFWGNCCTGGYDVNYTVTAPYANINIKPTKEISIDAGIRYDNVQVNGVVFPSQQVSTDINGNGTIDAPEKSISKIDKTNGKVVNYDYNYVSYTLGANYLINEESSVFARHSKGHVGNGERATWHQGGPYLENEAPKNILYQTELGYKRRLSNGFLYLTGFYGVTQEEAGVEATTQNVLSNDYRAFGLEVENLLRFKDIIIRSSVTYTDAEITDNDAEVNIGNRPRRQPAFTFSFMPSYTYRSKYAVGLNLVGQTQAYAQDNNELVMPGYVIVNGYISADLFQGLSLQLNVNNMANSIGITESEEGSITENQVNFIRARSISGRSINLRLAYQF